MARRARAVPRGVPAVTPVAVVQADGAILTDADGNRLIDFAGGIGVVNVGHRHPRVVAAVHAQLDHFAHVCFPVVSYEPYVALAERLNAVTPGTHDKRTVLVNSGAEAIENAVKIARAHTGRQAIVCFEHGFHGRTNLAMALTSKVRPYKTGFGPFAPEIYRLPYPYCYRCTTGPADGTLLPRVARTTRATVRGHRRPRLRRRDRDRAGARRRWFRPGPARIRARAVRLRARERHPPRRRRDPDWVRPHRCDVRLRALRSCPRHDRHRQVARRRSPSGRGHRTRR